MVQRTVGGDDNDLVAAAIRAASQIEVDRGRVTAQPLRLVACGTGASLVVHSVQHTLRWSAVQSFTTARLAASVAE